MGAAILCIGTELTRGELVNTNATWLSEQLTTLGLEVLRHEVIPDDDALMHATLSRLGEEASLIVCTGGLGPTTDDRTAQAVAHVLGVPLVRDERSLEVIRERMSRLGREMAASNAKQADFPAGARVLPNDWGTAPGFEVKLGRARAFFFPGVPREMKPLFERFVLPEVSALVREHVCQVRLASFGMTESAVNDALHGVEESFGVTVGYRAHFPEIEVKLLARDRDADAARTRARNAADEVRRRLGPAIVYGEGFGVTLPSVVHELLRERKLTLAVAESCTGGLVGGMLTDVPGSSETFVGGAIAYSNLLKEKLLGVPRSLLEEHGAVSEACALAMARGAQARFGADLAVAITGIAGPSGGTPEKPVGLVHFAAVHGAESRSVSLRYPASRERVRQLSAWNALSLVRRLLLGFEAASYP
jgi:nicotinamide-nucleotide amidase